MPLKDLEKIYNEFAKKMEQIITNEESKTIKVKET